MHSFLIALASWLVVLLALVLCFRLEKRSHQWLWALAVLFGIVQLSFGEAGGSYTLVSVSIALLRPDLVQAGAAPALPNLVVPIGALIFLLWRWSRAERKPG